MTAAERDWTQHLVDHIELHANDYETSVEFYTAVLAPLGVPHWTEDAETERITSFTRLSVVERQPATSGLHLCFIARSREQVDPFHRAGVDGGFRSTPLATATTRRAITPHSCSTR